MGLCVVPVISSVCEAVGEGPAALITAPFDWLAQSVANAAAWLFEGVWMIFESTTLVDITGGGYIGVYNIVFGIGVLVTFAFFCLQLLGGLIRREPGALARAATGMAKSILGGFILVVVTGILLEIVDQLCIGIVQASGNTMEQMGTKIGLLIGGLIGLNLAAPGAAAIIVIFLGFMAIAAGAIVWFSLLIRKALILVLVVLGPIALAGANWDVTRGWFAKWASFVLALIFSKFVVVLVFLVAITQVNAPIDLDISAISDPVAGIVLMLVAGFAPYMCYKLLAFAGVDMYALASTEQEAKQSVNRPVPIPHKPDAPAQLLEGSSSTGPNGTTPGGSAASSDPRPAPAESPAPPSGGNGGAGSTAGSGGAAASTGAGGSTAGAGTSTAGASAGVGAAAGPVGLAVVGGLTVAKSVAEAGPKTGAAVGHAAEEHAQGASGASSPPPASQPPQPSHTSPAPPPVQQPPSTPADPVPPKN